MAFLYPRLEKSEAILITEERRGKAMGQFDDPYSPINFGNATPKPTGGVPVSTEHLQNLRLRVFEALSKIDKDLVGPAWIEEYDRRLGKILWNNLEMIPGDAGSPEVWNFLSFVVLPNTCNARYSFESDDGLNRHLGAPRRVYLKNLWVRRRIYGNRLDQDMNVFSDDLHFQITDRVVTRTAPELCHEIVDVLSRTPNLNRTFYRKLLREIQAVASYVPFALLSQSENRNLVREIAGYVANALGVAPPRSDSPSITGSLSSSSICFNNQVQAVPSIDSSAVSSLQRPATPDIPGGDQASKPSEVRRHFESFKAVSEQAKLSALAKREEASPAPEEANLAPTESSSAVLHSDAPLPSITDAPQRTHDDVKLVNSFTLRTWRKIYNKLVFRELLEADAITVFENFLESKKATDHSDSTLMMRCMATALERGIMKPEDFGTKIQM